MSEKETFVKYQDRLAGYVRDYNRYVDSLEGQRNNLLARLRQLQAETEKYIVVANFALSFVDLTPEHSLYESIRLDLKAGLQALKNEVNENKAPQTRECRKCKWKKECVNVDAFKKGECLQYENRKE